MTAQRTLIVGGGIAGMQAALDLADAGVPVTIVDRKVTIGGKMAALDKNFPTLDCSICIEAPKISEVGEHPLIEVIANSEVVGLEGEPGDFRVRIKSKNPIVTDECTRCDDCVPACPQVIPGEFDEGLRARKAIFTPFAQAMPGSYQIDLDHCLNEPPNYLPCQRCVNACQPKCIDFSLAGETVIERDAASVIVSTGFDVMDVSLVKEYAYGRHPDVLTSMEFERLLNSAGPTGGHIVRPSDGEEPRRVLFVLCVGSRDQRHASYCSRFCCMYSMKQAIQARDHGIEDITVLYMDIRAYGKGFDGFWDRANEAGIRFVRGRPGWIRPTPANEGLAVRFFDTIGGKVLDESFDMVVLAGAVQPSAGAAPLAEALDLDLDTDGFFGVHEESRGLLESSRPGVLLAGCAGGPKDISDTVAEASAAAAAAAEWIRPLDLKPLPTAANGNHNGTSGNGSVSNGSPATANGAAAALSPNNPTQPGGNNVATPVSASAADPPRIGVILCHCGNNIGGVVNMEDLKAAVEAMPDVCHVETTLFACAGNAQNRIAELIQEKNLNRLVVSACSPTTHQATFRRACDRAGLNHYLMTMVNLRNHDTWVHKNDPAGAATKAVDMVRMGVEQARRLYPLHTKSQPLKKQALVVGGGIAGMAAAANLARRGIPVHLVEKRDRLGGRLLDLHTLSPGGGDAQAFAARMARDVEQTGVAVHLSTEVEHIGGHVGNFQVRLSDESELEIGAVVLAMGSESFQPDGWSYGADPRVVTNLQLESMTAENVGQNVTFVGCVGSRQGSAGCSRYCCESMLRQALDLRRAGKRVSVLYRDIRTQGRHGEELYAEASREGVRFFRFDPRTDGYPTWDNGVVRFYDELLGKGIALPTDLMVLVTGLCPVKETLSTQLRVPRSEDGFLLERHPKLGPAEVGKPGIYLAGTVQGPKGVKETVAGALAAAGKAAVLLSSDHLEKEPTIAQIDPEKCTGCTQCEPVCPFNAIQMVPVPGQKLGRAVVTEAACEGCGTCSATCNFDAITMPYFTKDQVIAQIDAALMERPEEKVLVFTCNWCSYAGADQAGIEKRAYPSSVRLIRTMCSGRVEEAFIARAFELGAGAVVITGCHLGDCHYLTANEWTQKRYSFWTRKFGRRGLEPERLRLEWVSASEGRKFADVMWEMDAVVKNRLVAAEEGDVSAGE